MNVKGDLYFTDSPGKKVWFVPKGGKPRIVDEGIVYANGVMFSPDQTLLYVSDYTAQLTPAPCPHEPDSRRISPSLTGLM